MGTQLPSTKKGKVPKFSAHVYCGQTAVWITMPLRTEVGLGPNDIVLHGDPGPHKKGTAPRFSAHVLWPNGCMYQDTTWYGGRPQPKRHCVRWGPSFRPLKGNAPPQFSVNVRCGQTAGWTKMPFCMKVGFGPGYFVFDRNPSLPRRKGTAPTQFLAHVYCGQTAGWIKMPLDTEVNLGPGDCVRWGRSSPPPKSKWGTAPSFRFMSIVAKRLDK